MQTVINWTRYDGTEATLPMTRAEYEALSGSHEIVDIDRLYARFLLCRGGEIRGCYYTIQYWPDENPKWSTAEYPSTDCRIGDLWAPWPAAPQE